MNFERLILEKLTEVHPRMMTETVLWSTIRIETEISLTDLRRHVSALESKSQVIVVKGEDATRIKITTDGFARLAE